MITLYILYHRCYFVLLSMLLLLHIFVVSSLCMVPNCICLIGINHSLDPVNANIRIIGGYEAVPHEFPWIVHFIRKKGRENVCGGIVVDEKWILTAAHCVTIADVADVQVVAGDHNQRIIESTEQTMDAVAVIVYPLYKTKNEYEHDIALVKLKYKLEFNDFVQPATLSARGIEYDGVATVAGWGLEHEMGSTMPSVLQKVNLPVVALEICQEKYHGLIDGPVITSNMICAGESGKDACQGDSGGPLMCYDPYHDHAIICGIVSFGMGCGRPDYPGVYTRVGNYVDWINSPEVRDSGGHKCQILFISCISYFVPLILSITVFL